MSICDVVIPIWNEPGRTQRCLESLLATTGEPIRLILIDNGSSQPTQDLLERFRSQSRFPVEILRNEINLGFIKAVNQGIRAARSPWICLLNNDTILTQDWLAEMLKVGEADPRIGLINPTSNSLGFHTDPASLKDYAAGLRSQSGRWTELSVALGFCLLARRSLFGQVGLLDESFGMGNFDDDDLSRRVRAHGLLCVRACGGYVYHEEKVSFRNLPGWEKTFEQNRRRFEEKWGRRLRILWAVRGGDPPAIQVQARAAAELARQGHWITLLAKKSDLPAEVLTQAQINRWDMPERSWRFRATWRLLTKRKKPFDLVIAYDPDWLGWVRRLRSLHRANLLSSPTDQEILDQCRILSRSPSWSAPEEARPLPAATPLPLSVVVITKNEASRLPACLDSVRWAGEIVVVDDESTDDTVAIAKSYTDRVIQRRMDIEGRHRNFAYSQAAYDWVLSLDADERVTPELRDEIIRLLRGQPPCPGYTVPRRNYLGPYWIRHGGWYPSPQLKLFQKDRFRYEESEVHPRAFMNGDCGTLTHDLIHHSYRDLADFLAKLNRQTTLEARKWVKDGRRMSLAKGLWRTFDRFFRTLWLKQGYRDGLLGYLVAVYAGLYQFLSYAKYWHLKNTEGKAVRLEGAGERAWVSQAGMVSRAEGEGRARDIDERTATLGPFASRESAALRSDRQTLSAVILTKNASVTIQACLQSVRWIDEVIVVDGGSTDGTCQIAEAAGAKVITETRADDFGSLRNLGTEQASGDWILQLDADEVITPEFRKALEQILLHPTPHVAYKFRRRNNFLGHWMRFGGWEHDSLHLFRKGFARYEGRVHERLLVDGSIGRLRVGVEHYPFRSLEEFIDRQNRYTTLEALQLFEKQQAPSNKELHYQITRKSAKLFWKLYIKKQGFREGRVGLIFCILYGFVHLIKWAKLWELAQQKEIPCGS